MQNGPLENGLTEPIVNGGNPDACHSSTPTVNGHRSQTPDQSKSHGLPQEQEDSERHNEAQDNNGPPSKRRKLADPATRHSSTPRPISPPWKKIAVEGPTSFIEGGRRKSSRTNFVPLELQPQANKRQTRANVQHTQIRKVKPAVLATFKSSPLIPSASQHTSHSKRPTSSGTNKSPSKATQTNGNSHKEQAIPATPVKRSHKKKVPAAPASASSITIPHPNRRVYRASDVSDPRSKTEYMATNGWYQSEDEDNSEQDSAEDEHQAVAAIGSPFKTQRLNLKVRMPTITISHPEHVPARRRHPSFQDWFHHEESMIGEGIPRVTDEEARREANLISKVLDAGQSGGLLSEERCSRYLPDHQDEPPQQYAHQDYMVAAVIDFQKRLTQERIKHKKRAKQIAEQCLVAWERRETRRGREVPVRLQVVKSAEEIETEVTDACETYYRQSVIGSLKRMFERVAAEIESRRRERWREEQQRLGRENLNRVLERSTRMLHKRSGVASGSGSEEESAGNSDVGSPSARTESVDDEMLTVEELHQKYAQLPSLRGSSMDISQSGDDAYDENSRRESVDVDPGGPAEQHTGDIPVSLETSGPASPDKTEAGISASISVADHFDEVLMDDSDASTNMDDDMGDSDRGSIDEGSDDLDQDTDRGGESEVSDQEAGLLGFFPKGAWKNDVRHSDAEGAEQADQLMVEEDHTEMSVRTEEARPLPDATQVQTPSASNGEEPVLGHTKASNDKWTKGSEITEADVSQQALSDQPLTARIPSIELEGVNKQPYQHLSLPTPPVSTTAISTPVPSLLRGTLREYQHVGLDWLAKLYSNRQNGILADEMGLGKTIQTIALLAHLAINHEAWGPHLIVVPTSVMLNWEMEFKKFLPGFKVLTYYGTIEERKRKREGWMNDDKWNVWITSYALVVQDNQIFRRRDWHYMILDEAHNIKNFRSQRWQTLLNFKTRARLLLTGTPLQNNLTELWSLLFFTISAGGAGQGANGFASLQEFSDWFQEPVKQILEHGKETMDENTQGIVNKLHHTLRPHLLRRLKADVEKQMPGKYEHIVYCRLSKRQRELYQGFLNRADTKAIYASGNHLSMMNCIMQLRKVCCHPDLFETRQIVTSFAMSRSVVADFEIKDLLIRRRLLQEDLGKTVDLGFVNLLPGANEPLSALDTIQKQRLGALGTLRQLYAQQWSRFKQNMHFDGSSVKGTLAHMENVAKRARFESLRHASYHTMLRSQRRPLYSHGLLSRLDLGLGTYPLPPQPLRNAQLAEHSLNMPTSLADMIVTLPRRSQAMETTIQKYACITPKVVATDIRDLATPRQALDVLRPSPQSSPRDAFHEPRMRLSIAFPDKRLLQFDCGKLQSLDSLLRKLQAGGHRALVFTQMTKVLDVLEQFLNIHGWRYLRLDGGTKIEQRQILTERFNNDEKIPVFILSTRSGGLGINLTGADSVIFYDSDWNPAMDKQCQDRSHRIGQTRDVHIYRLVSESTVEVNIMRRARQKTRLDEVVIQEGQFTTDRFQDVTAIDLASSAPDDGDEETNAALDRVLGGRSMDKVFAQVEDKEDVAAAKIAEKEMLQTDVADFEEKAIPSSAGAMTPKTPAPQTPRPPSAGADTGADAVEQPADPAVVVPDATDPIPTAATPAVDVAVRVTKVAEKAGHIDDYMLRLIEWELKDVPLPPDPDMIKKKKKKGEEHKVRKRVR
ncbi:helicase swr1 [Physcia stellaris]|nr:helicase swr1 [Physcia stellaris]